jgi:peptidoglycan/LPS O-acetylase OafA/YrhL
MSKGDYGVDIFFVLSGFLIAYILLKECEKFGPKVDIWNFYRGRLLRLYPAMIPCVLLIAVYLPQKWEVIYSLFFINNYLGTKTHLWSVAVEIQMYIISPFLV